jgi:hypothetical protein
LFEDMIKTNIKGITKVNLSIKYWKLFLT